MVKRYVPPLMIVVAFFLILNTGCQKGQEYRQYDKYQDLVSNELAKGVRHDSLFLGYKFGMTKKEFYAYSWKLNKKEVVHQGVRNLSVRYDFNDLGHKAKMNFYPTFYNDKIYQMPVVVSYRAWAPWNDNLSADSLQVDLMHLFEKWYGKGFIKLKDKKKGLIYVKVDGNRAISIFKANTSGDVNVLFTDLRVQQEKEKKEHPLAFYWNKFVAVF